MRFAIGERPVWVSSHLALGMPSMCLATACLILACRAPAPSAPLGTGAGGDGAVVVVTERTDELTLPAELQQTPDPRSEAALRRHIESIQKGTPNYDELAPGLQAAIRSQPKVLESIAELGSIASLTFRGKSPQGADAFEVATANGTTNWLIELDAAGKTIGLLFRPGPPRTIPSEAELLEQTRAELDRASANDMFAGVVLLAKNGKPILEGARGLADRDKRVPIDMDTQFRIGSMNKMFTAVAVLQLREAGKLGLDDTLARWLPDYPNTKLAQSVTLHHLLTHTGGTGDIFGPDYDAHQAELLTPQDYVNVFGKRDLEFEPGQRFEYSNYGFVLLGRVIEKASGQSYYDYLDQHVFGPAGMKATGSPLESAPVAHRSVGYHRAPEGLISNARLLPPRASPAGGGLSTAADMLRFAEALQHHTLLSADSTSLLTTRKVPMGPPGLWYAYGFTERDSEGIHWYGHNGGFPGMNAEFEVFPETGYVLVVMANLDPPAAGVINGFVAPRLPRVERPSVAPSTPSAPASPSVARAPAEAPSGPNLIENGDLSAGSALWSTMLWPVGAEPQPMPSRIEAGALCATVHGGENVILGWPSDPKAGKGFALTSGQRY
ncbi:MAG TPA: serine hydrolase domain-containing protein, partial [Polyangiaceae bacterium]|nr:serine hydrolase domain-containing protein [Polyangiaceae bacterium]